ncbi:MAG: hypothetical protein RL477_2188, partial [Pseudomonadota bacterium]
ILAFLDVAGDWNPTLAFVMAGALAAAAPGFWLARRRGHPALGGDMQVPTRRDIDARLVAGAVLFGLGWGLAGICPGPAIAGLATGARAFLVFVPALFAGFALYALYERLAARK